MYYNVNLNPENFINTLVEEHPSVVITQKSDIKEQIKKYDNVKNIITVGENLYNNIASHAQNLLNIQQTIDKAASSIKTEVNRFTTKRNGSIFKEAEKLKQFGISSKEVKSGKKIIENDIPQIFLEDSVEEISENSLEEVEV